MSKQKHLVIQHLENISGKVLQEYVEVIKELIRGKAGVYALYRKNRLYYIGLASDLMRQLKIHLKDRHKELWDRFSVYLTVHDEHIKELESLLLRIDKPKGNKSGGRFIKSINLKSNLNKKIKRIDDNRRSLLIGRSFTINKKIKKSESGRGSKAFSGILNKRIVLKAVYKKKEYHAVLRKNGIITLNGKQYNSPSSAAFAISSSPIDGWYFWKFKNEKGNWVKLNELRK